jgi:hypothetical protein
MRQTNETKTDTPLVLKHEDDGSVGVKRGAWLQSGTRSLDMQRVPGLPSERRDYNHCALAIERYGAVECGF